MWVEMPCPLFPLIPSCVATGYLIVDPLPSFIPSIKAASVSVLQRRVSVTKGLQFFLLMASMSFFQLGWRLGHGWLHKDGQRLEQQLWDCFRCFLPYRLSCPTTRSGLRRAFHFLDQPQLCRPWTTSHWSFTLCMVWILGHFIPVKLNWHPMAVSSFVTMAFGFQLFPRCIQFL